MNNKFFGVLVVLAVLLRFLVAPVTLHGDLLYIWSVPTLTLEGIWDPYSYATSHYQKIAASDYDVYYPPGTYMVTAVFLHGLRFFSPTLVPWLVGIRESSFLLENRSLENYLSPLNQNQRHLNIFLLKIPYVFFEVVLLLFLSQLVQPPWRRRATLLWLWNPVVVYTTYLWGQIDILTAMLLVIMTVAVIRSQRVATITALVLATMIKTLPIILWIPVASVLARPWSKGVIVLTGIITLFLAGNLPWIKDLERLNISYFPSVMASPFDFSLRPDSVIATMKLFLSGLIGLFLAVNVVRRSPLGPRNIVGVVTIVMLLFFSAYRGTLLNHYVVLVPFLLLSWSTNPRAGVKIGAFSFLLFLSHVYTRPLQGELFTPLGIERITHLPSTREVIAPVVTYEHVALFTSTVLSIWMMWEAWRIGRILGNENP